MSNVIIPTSPVDRQKIYDGIKEISNSITRVDGERDLVKEILTKLETEVGLPKKYARKLAKVYHKQNIAEVSQEATDLEELYQSIIK